MLAVAKAKLHLGLDPSDVRVLSVGAGSWARRVVEPTASEKDLDLGLADWAPHLLEMVIDASGMTTDMEASFLLRENYTRLSPLIPRGVSLALDDPSTLQRQLQYAQDTDIDKAVDFAKRVAAEPSSILELPDEPLGDSVHDLKEVRSRRPAVRRRLHTINATRVHQTRSWVVSFLISRPFGPRRATPMPRAGPNSARTSPTGRLVMCGLLVVCSMSCVP